MKKDIEKRFIKWCDEPMSANGNDRKEMFEEIWVKATLNERKRIVELVEGNIVQIKTHACFKEDGECGLCFQEKNDRNKNRILQEILYQLE